MANFHVLIFFQIFFSPMKKKLRTILSRAERKKFAAEMTISPTKPLPAMLLFMRKIAAPCLNGSNSLGVRIDFFSIFFRFFFDFFEFFSIFLWFLKRFLTLVKKATFFHFFWMIYISLVNEGTPSCRLSVTDFLNLSE